MTSLDHFSKSLEDSTTQLHLRDLYKKSSIQYTNLRKLPTEHYKTKLTGSKSQIINFLPGISVIFDQNLIKSDQICSIKTTSVRSPFNKINDFEKVKRLSSFFDISCKPLGSKLNKPIEIRLKFTEEDKSAYFTNKNKALNNNEKPFKFFLNSFDYNTREWNEIICNTEKLDNENYIYAKVQFFGKFCFSCKSSVQEFILTEVATNHTVSSQNDYFVKMSISDNVIKRGCSLISLYSIPNTSQTLT